MPFALHPGCHHLRDAVLAIRDVLANQDVVIARALDPHGHGRFVGTGVIERVVLGHVLRVRRGSLRELFREFERPQAFFLPLDVVRRRAALLRSGRAASTAFVARFSTGACDRRLGCGAEKNRTSSVW